MIDSWRAEGKTVLVHCSAGLSRSASIILAYLLRSQPAGTRLRDAVALLTSARGRMLQVNPGFWMQLAAEERRLDGTGTGTVPSFDFTAWWEEDFGRMGVGCEKIREALRTGDWIDFNVASDFMFK